MTTCDVALLTTGTYLAPPMPDDWYAIQIHREDQLLADELRALGLTVMRVDWSDDRINWNEFRSAVFRTTWDYFDRFAEFTRWLDHAALQTRLINGADLVRWNMDKHYLGDLARAGVDVVPTVFVERGAPSDLASICREHGWDEIVVKPAVSGAARLTFRCSAGDLAGLQPTFDKCVANEAMLIQPFQPDILSAGELSLIVIDGLFTHAIRKTPKAGDFRVQDDHGGTVHPHTATEEETLFAERAVAACSTLPAYARVDIVSTAKGCRLMELELIEPELFLRFHPPAAAPLARAIRDAIRN